MSLERFVLIQILWRYSVASVQRRGRELLLSWWLMWRLLLLHPHLWFSQDIWTFMSQSHASGLPEGEKKHFFSLRMSLYCFLSCLPRECRDWLWTEGEWGQDGQSCDNASSFDAPQFSAVQLNWSLAWHRRGVSARHLQLSAFLYSRALGLPLGCLQVPQCCERSMHCPCFLPHGTGILKAIALPKILCSRHCVGDLQSLLWPGDHGPWCPRLYRVRWAPGC